MEAGELATCRFTRTCGLYVWVDCEYGRIFARSVLPLFGALEALRQGLAGVRELRALEDLPHERAARLEQAVGRLKREDEELVAQVLVAVTLLTTLGSGLSYVRKTQRILAEGGP